MRNTHLCLLGKSRLRLSASEASVTKSYYRSIGKEAFSKVYHAVDLKSSLKYAIKKIHLAKFEAKQRECMPEKLKSLPDSIVLTFNNVMELLSLKNIFIYS